MDEGRSSTRTLAVLSTLCCGSALLAVVTLAIILAHWHEALNSCTHADCGCLLYARSLSTTLAVNGSDVAVCWFVTTAPLPGVVVAAVLAAVYGYRGYIRRRPQSQPPLPLTLLPRSALAPGPRGGRAAQQHLLRDVGAGLGTRLPRTRPNANVSPNEAMIRSKRLSRRIALLTAQAIVCMLMALFAVAHVAVLTDGFLTSCHEYRHAVLRILRASGSLALLVNERLSCSVVFDFLDYMKPDARELVQGNNWFPGQRKLSTVNTAAALIISLMASYACMVLWFVLAVQFASLGRRASRMSKLLTRQSRVQYALHSTDL